MTVWTYDDATRAAVRARLAAHPRAVVEDPQRRAAAVAVTIVGDGGQAACLLTRRAAGLRDHGGQYALPGGRLDPGEGPVDAAVRELDEELAIADVEVLGVLDDYPTRSGYRITPVVVWAAAGTVPTPRPAEVAAVHRVPVAHLAERAPRFAELPDARGPVIELPIAGTFIYAPTGAILHQFAEVALHGRATRVSHFDEPPFARR